MTRKLAAGFLMLCMAALAMADKFNPITGALLVQEALTPAPTITNTFTYTPTHTLTFTPTYTDTGSVTPTYTFTPTYTGTIPDPGTHTETPTYTDTGTITATYTPTFTMTNTKTYTPTYTPTKTYSPAAGVVVIKLTDTPTFTYTPTFNATQVFGGSYTPTFTLTPTHTPTMTPQYASEYGNSFAVTYYFPAAVGTQVLTPCPFVPQAVQWILKSEGATVNTVVGSVGLRLGLAAFGQSSSGIVPVTMTNSAFSNNGTSNGTTDTSKIQGPNQFLYIPTFVATAVPTCFAAEVRFTR